MRGRQVGVFTAPQQNNHLGVVAAKAAHRFFQDSAQPLLTGDLCERNNLASPTWRLRFGARMEPTCPSLPRIISCLKQKASRWQSPHCPLTDR